MIAAPYYPIDTATPAWARLISGDNNRITHEIDARGSGLYGGVTPQTLIPHGETVSTHASAMVQSNAAGGQGIGHSLQGFVRGPTGSAVRVYDNELLTSSDPALWITDTFDDYRRVSFIDQMPENIVPEWMQSTFVLKSDTGQARFANLEFRDHYSRRFKREVSGADWTSFGSEVAQNFILGRSANISRIYIDTTVANIAKGQNISVELSMYIIQGLMTNNIFSQLIESSFGVGLKFTRTSDGGSDWWGVTVGTSDDRKIAEQVISRSETFVAQDSYRQVELLVWAINRSTQTTGAVQLEHDGIKLDLNINDSLESGS